MSPMMLRQLWSLVEGAQSSLLLTLDDSSLVQWLLEQVTQQTALTSAEVESLSGYIRSKLTLIRDLAQSR